MYEIHTLDDGTMVKAVPKAWCYGCVAAYGRKLCQSLPDCSASKRLDNQSVVFKRHIRLAVEVKE